VNYQSYQIIGHLTRQIELAYTPSQVAYAKGGIAESEKWKGKDGTPNEHTVFIDWVAWGARAETMGKYLEKGQAVMLIGKFKQDQWEDKATGAKRSKLVLTVDTFVFMPQKDPGPARQQPPEQPAPDEDVPFV